MGSTARRNSLVLVLAVAALAAGAGIVAHAKSAKPAADLSGQWQLDPSRSDLPGGREGRGGGFRRREWNRPDGGAERGGMPGRGQGERPRPRGGRLPRMLRIEQAGDLVTIADSTGTTVQEIRIGRAPGGTADEGVQQLAGRWHDGKLETERSTERGSMVQTFSLDDGGRTLVVRTEMKSSDGGMSREFKRVYRKVSGS